MTGTLGAPPDPDGPVPATAWRLLVAAPDPSPAAGPAGPRSLTEAREAVGLTQAALARALHVSRPLVSSWERGDRRPGRSHWPALAAALQVTREAVSVLFASHPPARLDGVPLPSLSAARRHAGLQQQTVARLVGVAPTTVSMWESAGVRVAPVLAARLAMLLGTSTEALAARPPSRPREDDDPRPLRRLRRAAGMTRAEAAAHLGIAVATLSRYEAGERRPPVAVARSMSRTYRRPVPEVLASCGITLVPLPAGPTWSAADLPAAILAARVARGLTKVALGRAVGRSGQAVRTWELGRARPDPATCRRLETVLGLPVGKLPR